MRAYMLEKLCLLANNARIIYNHLQPKRAPIGIKPATEMLVMELVQPWLQAKKERALKVKESKEESKGSSANLTKKSRVGWTTSKIVWSPPHG